MTGRKLAEAEPERESDAALVSTISTRYIRSGFGVGSLELLCVCAREAKIVCGRSLVVINK